MNADMLLGEAGAVLSHNAFAYCDNNPANMSDPAGSSPLPAMIGAVIGAAAGVSKTAAMIAKAPGPNGLELMSKERIDFLFGKNLYDVEVTDLISGKTFAMTNWDPNPGYHSDPRFPDDGGASRAIARSIFSDETDETYWKNWRNWSKDARPVSVSVTDRFGIKREIAAGFVLFPHHKVYSNFGQGGEMCMFYGFNTRGYARDHGNEAAMNAYNGILSIVKQRNPI